MKCLRIAATPPLRGQPDRGVDDTAIDLSLRGVYASRMSGSGPVVALSVAVAFALSLGCGHTDRRSAAAGMSAGGDSHLETADGTSGAGGDSAGPIGDAITLEASDCAARPLGDCEGVQSNYESNEAFDETPALARCSSFNSFDGCGSLIFGFDARGCAISVAPGSGGWQSSAHLSELQHCLADTFAEARWPCLASSSVRYDESCFIR